MEEIEDLILNKVQVDEMMFLAIVESKVKREYKRNPRAGKIYKMFNERNNKTDR